VAPRRRYRVHGAMCLRAECEARGVMAIPCPGDSSSTLMAIGSLAGNVSVSASSSKSFICAISAEGDFCGFFRMIMTSEPFFAFASLVYWMFAPATKGGASASRKVRSEARYL